jgi:hypothetical protein
MGVDWDNFDYSNLLPLPQWAVDLMNGELRDPAGLAGWVRSRPRKVQAVMRAFPPHAIVRANRRLMCPAPRTVGFVYGYSEQDDGSVHVYVLQSPDSQIYAHCLPEELVVVGYDSGVDPEWVERAIGGERC